MNWLSRLFQPKETSAQIAKNRLKFVLTIDRMHVTPELLNILQDEIVRVISQHLDIDREGMTIEADRGEGGERLRADIPILGIRAATPPPAEPTPQQQYLNKKNRHKHRQSQQYARD